MSKSLQILLACIIAACVLLGYLVSRMLAPESGPAALNGSTHATQTPAIRWPVPTGRESRRVYAEMGRQVFITKGCWQCHHLGAETFPGEVNTTAEGPDLGFVGDRLTFDEIVESIVNPNAVIAGPSGQNSTNGVSKMPSSVENLSTGDLVRLATFLSERRAGADLQLDDGAVPPPAPSVETPPAGTPNANAPAPATGAGDMQP